MKKQLIRHDVFETNSSSSHSISVAGSSKEFVLDTLYPDQHGKIQLTGGEFGWEWAKYNDALTKANYYAVDCQHDEDKLELLKEVIIEQTGAELVDLKIDGYIDHDSCAVARDACPTKEDLKDFIFNKNSWLFTGNDNSTADPTFYKVPEFKGGRMILPQYRFELKIEGYEKTTKFEEMPTEDELSSAFNSMLQSVYLTDSGYFDDDMSIMAQLQRNTDRCFQFNDWKRKTDYKKKTLFFIKDAYSDAQKEWKLANPNADWQKDKGYEAVRKIEDKLYAKKNSPYIKAVKYELAEL